MRRRGETLSAGGVILQWWLGYRFSVAVCVSYIIAPVIFYINKVRALKGTLKSRAWLEERSRHRSR